MLDHPSAVMGLAVVVLYVLAAVLAPWLTPHTLDSGDLSLRLRPPAWAQGGEPRFLLGTDGLGQDLLTWTIYGVRVSILVGLLATGFSVLAGTALGLVAGYHRGWADQALSRLADLLLSFPFLIFAIGMMAMLGPGFWNLIMALSFKGWVEFYRLVRGEVLAQKTHEYVEAARALGRPAAAVMFSEILPNVLHSVLVLGTLRIGYFIVLEASLSFLGLGVPPAVPAWGSMINRGREVLSVAYWVSTFPGVALVVLVLGINLLGEGLRDILDPRLKVERG